MDIENIDSNSHNGLMTTIWGPSGWIFCHAITFGYPLNPTKQQQDFYKQFFTRLGNVLPCCFCRESYNYYISNGDTQFNDDTFKNRENLTKWFYNIHNAVNNKLGIEYTTSYSDVIEKYENFRAKCGKIDREKKGCITPLNYKAYSFKKLNEIDCPIIHREISGKFIDLAKARGIPIEYFTFYYYIVNNNINIVEIRKSELWENRNKICREIRNTMKENGIPSIEKNNLWCRCPTVYELLLILFFCSNLNNDELNNILKNLTIFK